MTEILDDESIGSPPPSAYVSLEPVKRKGRSTWPLEDNPWGRDLLRHEQEKEDLRLGLPADVPGVLR